MSTQLKVVDECREISDFLEAVELFKQISDHKNFVGEISTHMIIRNYKKGEAIFEEGQKAENLYILQQGEVFVQKSNPEGDVYNVIILSGANKPAIGEGGLIEASARSATVRCKTDCSFLILSRIEFEKFCDEHPKWGIEIYRSIFKLMIARLRKMNTDLMLLHKALTNEIRG
ncbi:MAG: cyclic nucleotide-binding domain-containing protein [Bdellovibrionales bacterium]